MQGCSRYAPIAPPPPQYQIMDIRITANDYISDEIYYYLAFEINSPLSTDGPDKSISGPEAAKNWDYYIRVYGNNFSEFFISNEEDIDKEPDVFDSTSPRFYYTQISGDTIRIRLLIDQLTTPPDSIAFNFITSYYPISITETENYFATDYFEISRVDMTTEINAYTNSVQYSTASSHTIGENDDQAAEIIYWSVSIYEL